MYRAEEDYIKLIYTLTIECSKELAKTTELAKTLNHSNQTVIEMVKKLEMKDFLKYTPYKGIRLTKRGKEEALRIIRAHRVWEVFLTEKLGYSWDEVHEEAELLEHASSKQIIDKLYVYLNEPSVCQHGNPIPNEEGQIDDLPSVSLKSFIPPGKFLILRVSDNKDVLNFLNQNNLSVGSVVKIDKIDFDNYILTSNNKKIYINQKIASSIYGKRLSN